MATLLYAYHVTVVYMIERCIALSAQPSSDHREAESKFATVMDNVLITVSETYCGELPLITRRIEIGMELRRAEKSVCARNLRSAKLTTYDACIMRQDAEGSVCQKDYV